MKNIGGALGVNDRMFDRNIGLQMFGYQVMTERERERIADLYKICMIQN